MNIYILTEGKTERKVYPKWLTFLLPQLTKVERPALVVQNNYCLVSANGYPSILGYIAESIAEINDIGTFDFFIVVADTDDNTLTEITAKIQNHILNHSLKLENNTQLVLILQRCCIETWFLGNRKIFKKHPQDPELKKIIQHFNVAVDDPEEMLLPYNFQGSIGQFHKYYLKKVLAERNISYSETHPMGVAQEPYLRELIKRYEKTGHLSTFGNFLEFCKKLTVSNT